MSICIYIKQRRQSKVFVSVPNKRYGFGGRKVPRKKKVESSEFRSCVEVEVDVLGSPSLIVLIVSVDLKHRERRRWSLQSSGDV